VVICDSGHRRPVLVVSVLMPVLMPEVVGTQLFPQRFQHLTKETDSTRERQLEQDFRFSLKI
jgi:hypothetical protein